MKKTLLVIVLLAMGCKSNPDKHIEFIEGYWEIESVYKDNQLLRTFKINSGIDSVSYTHLTLPTILLV